MKNADKNMKRNLLFALMLLFIGSSSFGQHPCENKYGKDSVETVRNLSLFNQYYQMKKYAEAYPYWQYLFENAPCVNQRITVNGYVIVKSKMKELQKSDKEAFNARLEGLIDTVLLSHIKRIYYWGEEGYVLGKYANDLSDLRPAKRDSALYFFAKSYEMEGMNSDDRFPMYYMEAAVKQVEAEKLGQDSLYTIYFKMMDLIGHNLKHAKNEKATKDWELSNEVVNKLMSPYLKGEKLQEYFQPKIEAAPTDLDLLKRASSLMTLAGYEKEDFYIEVAEKIYAVSPSGESALAIANSYYAKKKYDKAITYYEKSVGSMAAGDEKAQVYLKMANMMYEQGKYSSAKNYASQSIENNPKNGEAYLIIAQYYANNASSCSQDNLDGRSVFWAAVDKCVQAKSADPGVEDRANKLIAAYAAAFPKKEDAFFKGFTQDEGSSYTVPCLGVSTTVRYKN